MACSQFGSIKNKMFLISRSRNYRLGMSFNYKVGSRGLIRDLLFYFESYLPVITSINDNPNCSSYPQKIRNLYIMQLYFSII